MPNAYTGTCLFVDRVQKRNCYISVSTLTCKNIRGSFFLDLLSINMFFLPFFDVLTLKLISGFYLVQA